MFNKNGIRILGKDEEIFGMKDIQSSEVKKPQHPGLDRLNRYPILREAFQKAINSK